MRIYQGLLAGALLGLLEATTFIIERPVKDRGDRFLVAGCLLLMIPFFVALLSVISSALIGWAETLGSRWLGGGSRGIGVLAGVLVFPFAQALTSGEAIRKGQFKPIPSHQFGNLLVFDLDADPNETENLASSHPDTAAELEDLILSFDVGRGGYFARLYGENAIVDSARDYVTSADASLRRFAGFILRSRGIR